MARGLFAWLEQFTDIGRLPTSSVVQCVGFRNHDNLLIKAYCVETDSELQLIERIKGGDMQAFSALVDAHQVAIRAYLAVRINDPVEADDLAQDVFITAYKRLGTFDSSSSFHAWAKGIAFNVFRNFMRRRRDEAAGSADDLESFIHGRIEVRDSERAPEAMMAALHDCVAKLGEQARKLIAARYEERLSIEQIAESDGRKHSAMTMILHRIRQQLRKCVEARMAGGLQ